MKGCKGCIHYPVCEDVGLYDAVFYPEGCAQCTTEQMIRDDELENLRAWAKAAGFNGFEFVVDVYKASKKEAKDV